MHCSYVFLKKPLVERLLSRFGNVVPMLSLTLTISIEKVAVWYKSLLTLVQFCELVKLLLFDALEWFAIA